MILVGSGYYYARATTPRLALTSSTTPISEAPNLKHETRSFILQAVWAECVEIVGKENVITAPSELESHAGSSWSTHISSPGHLPFMVVRPLTTEHVAAIMSICHERRVPVTPYSGGTSLEGHFYSYKRGCLHRLCAYGQDSGSSRSRPGCCGSASGWVGET